MLENSLLIGNIIALIGALFMVAIGLVKNKRNILIMQNIQFFIMGIGNLILGGVSGFVANIVSIIRNFFCLKKELTVFWKVFFVIVQIVVSAYFMSIRGFKFQELLPILGTVLYTWKLDEKDMVKLKIVLIICQIMWLTYDISLRNVSGAVFDVLTIVTNALGIIRIRKDVQDTPVAEMDV